MTDKPTSKTLEIDWDLYETWLAESDLTEAEKRQFLEALWSLVVMFVDMGFGLHPTQQSCGQMGEARPAKLEAAARDMLDLKRTFTRHQDAAVPGQNRAVPSPASERSRP